MMYSLIIIICTLCRKDNTPFSLKRYTVINITDTAYIVKVVRFDINKAWYSLVWEHLRFYNQCCTSLSFYILPLAFMSKELLRLLVESDTLNII